MENTLWFPEGVKKGDVVYDLNNKVFAIGDKAVDGTNIRKIRPISKEEAEAFIKAGSNKLISVKE